MFENGAKNAMPSPPLVIASSRPCEAVTAKKKITISGQALRNDGVVYESNPPTASPITNANRSECVSPR